MADNVKKSKPEKPKEYDYEQNLNWRDDGDELGDASMNDYLKGYQIEPYAFQQWANKKNIKIAAQEVINMHYYPEFLADYILTLWNGTDGTLQNYFEGFTLRYNNNMKQSIANELAKKGYKVHPILTDDRAYYASKVNKIVKKASKTSIATKLDIARKMFKDSEALRLCLGEIADITEMGIKVSKKRVADLIDYYKNIFPEDYALCLTDNLVQEREDNELEHYKDFNLSDEALMSIENMLNGNREPYSPMYDGGDGEMGYDYISQMRGFDGVTPEQYELPTVRSARLKKKRLSADAIGNVPLSEVMDAIQQASKNVNVLLKEKFAIPPVPIRSIRRQKNRAKSKIDDFYTVVNVPDILDVFEVWKLTLNDSEYSEVFVVISATCEMAGYKKAKWSNVEYRGFYSTVDEAIHDIYGNLA